jgi:membrane fusion protein (multidrug efflux system)
VTPASTFTARVEAVDSVDLRARVPGYLERQLFKEGAEIKAGDLLFVLEKGQYEAAINEIKATITRGVAAAQPRGAPAAELHPVVTPLPTAAE